MNFWGILLVSNQNEANRVVIDMSLFFTRMVLGRLTWVAEL